MQLPRLHANEARKPASGFNCYVLFRFSLRFEWQKPPSTLLGPSNARSCPLPNLHKKEKKKPPAIFAHQDQPNHPPPTRTGDNNKSAQHWHAERQRLRFSWEIWSIRRVYTCDTAQKTTYLTHYVQVQIFNFNLGLHPKTTRAFPFAHSPICPTQHFHILPTSITSSRHVRETFPFANKLQLELNLPRFHSDGTASAKMHEIIHSFFVAQVSTKLQCLTFMLIILFY